MSGAGKWFIARPVLKDSGPEYFGRTATFNYRPVPPATGSTSMSAS